MGGEGPFFMKGGAVVGYHAPDAIRLERLRDRAKLDVRAFETDDGRCAIYAADSAGGFEGDPRGGLGIRLGDDLRTSEVVTSGPRFEVHRKKDLVATFLGGP